MCARRVNGRSRSCLAARCAGTFLCAARTGLRTFGCGGLSVKLQSDKNYMKGRGAGAHMQRSNEKCSSIQKESARALQNQFTARVGTEMAHLMLGISLVYNLLSIRF